ncbi:MAG TPA: glycogen/starch synthase [Bacteroidia bacterium]|nr:glycogen/starch synthase [Bacteroidota bacterium]HRC32611.1 glycogen/starch synthase [Bacteroidia bacterium]
MMKKTKVLFVTQEISPYLDETELSKICRYLPQGTQESGKEIRVFMPKYGTINERRNQLHEVIRLSGMNLIIDDTDHPLIIKVASIQSARMQVYFIDNEEYFQRKATVTDAKGKHFKDNDDRTIFYCRGVLETVKKLGWQPDVIHCHGWMTSLIPLFIKTSYKEDPHFKNAKVVYSLYNDSFEDTFNPEYSKKLMMEGIAASDVKELKDPTYSNIVLNAMSKSDAFIQMGEDMPKEYAAHIKKSGKPCLKHPEENYIKAYNEFYELIAEEETIEA